MSPREPDPVDRSEALRNLRTRAELGELRVTQHAHQEMVAEGISLQDVLEAVSVGEILENYPRYRRGPCCLLYGTTASGRDLHVVCTTVQPMLVIITVYQPRPPKWPTPTQRTGGT